MKAITIVSRYVGQVAVINLLLMTPLAAEPDDGRGSLENLGALWQQWALSIPTELNPQLGADDPTSDYSTAGKCAIGQRGSVWFLAGTFGGGKATRTCSVPEGKALFFPVVNAVQINAPNVCGQGPDDIPVRELRAAAAAFVDGTADYGVELDGQPIRPDRIARLRSRVFEVALPESNVFDAPCAPLNVPGGIFSPAVDDGRYVLLGPLRRGTHTLCIHAENAGQGFLLDVSFILNVIPVRPKEK